MSQFNLPQSRSRMRPLVITWWTIFDITDISRVMSGSRQYCTVWICCELLHTKITLLSHFADIEKLSGDTFVTNWCSQIHTVWTPQHALVSLLLPAKSLATGLLMLCTTGFTFIHLSTWYLAAIISDLATNLYCPLCNCAFHKGDKENLGPYFHSKRQNAKRMAPKQLRHKEAVSPVTLAAKPQQIRCKYCLPHEK